MTEADFAIFYFSLYFSLYSSPIFTLSNFKKTPKTGPSAVRNILSNILGNILSNILGNVLSNILGNKLSNILGNACA